MLWDEVGVDAAAVVMGVEEVVDVESDGEAAIGVFATEVDDAGPRSTSICFTFSNEMLKSV